MLSIPWVTANVAVIMLDDLITYESRDLMSQNEPSPKQLQVIEHMINGQTVVKSAELTGVGRSTIQKWKT